MAGHQLLCFLPAQQADKGCGLGFFECIAG